MPNSLEELPSGAGNVARTYPAVWEAYSAVGKACTSAGPIDGRTARLLKLAFAIGASQYEFKTSGLLIGRHCLFLD
jgi:alkylhydroperoxidase/carboxymuconolactone decarboxylase family protein YurZ